MRAGFVSSGDSSRGISGTWHLVDRSADEVDVPAHRMDLRFEHVSGRLRAVVLSRATGEEMAVIHGASFDGVVLRLQMTAPAGTPQAAMPFLVMRTAGATLVGRWQQDGVAVGPELKLVRDHRA